MSLAILPSGVQWLAMACRQWVVDFWVLAADEGLLLWGLLSSTCSLPGSRDIPKHAWVAHMRIVGVRHDKADHGQDDASKRKRVPFVFDEVVSDAMAQLRKELVKVIHRHDYENLLSARA